MHPGELGGDDRAGRIGGVGDVDRRPVARTPARQARAFERVAEHLADDELSIGDYVLTNGALPAMVVIDAVARLLPGVLGDDESSKEESFSADGPGLEYPQYTRPAEFRGKKVPDVLLSGNHAEIRRWRKRAAVTGLATLREHIARGDRVVVVTAAPQWLAERLLAPFAGDLQVIGSTLHKAGGGWIVQRHCRGI